MGYRHDTHCHQKEERKAQQSQDRASCREAKEHCAESVQPHVDSCVPSVGLLSASAFVLSVFLSPQWSPCASLSVSAARRSSPSNTCHRRKNEKRRDSPDRASVRRAGALGRRREASFLP